MKLDGPGAGRGGCVHRRNDQCGMEMLKGNSAVCFQTIWLYMQDLDWAVEARR